MEGKKNKIFLLGVGAQKAGTTWLYRQLCGCPNVDMGFMKEYHVFDAIFSPHCSAYRDFLLETFEDRLRAGMLGENSGDQLVKRLSFIDNAENYFEYFDYLYCRNKDVEMVGDITPSYAMLNSSAFGFIKEGLESKGFYIKPVFIMRDPVERIWSMLRMIKIIESQEGTVNEQSESERFVDIAQTEGCKLRTCYERTARNLEKVFSEGSIYYGLYERFFSASGYRVFSESLGVELSCPDFVLRENESPKTQCLEPGAIEIVASLYRETYEFGIERFGASLEKIWGGFRYLK